jgi:hypothetical protein
MMVGNDNCPQAQPNRDPPRFSLQSLIPQIFLRSESPPNRDPPKFDNHTRNSLRSLIPPKFSPSERVRQTVRPLDNQDSFADNNSCPAPQDWKWEAERTKLMKEIFSDLESMKGELERVANGLKTIGSSGSSQLTLEMLVRAAEAEGMNL